MINIAGKFNFIKFYSRYIAGGESLKNHITISRIRLNLAMSGISKNDYPAVSLWKQSKAFCDAFSYLSEKKTISLDDICEINSIVTANKELSGKIRNVNNWIGQSKETAHYTPPPFEMVQELLDDLIREINSLRYKENDEKIIHIYKEFLRIHPFVDGNGRCARVLWLSLIKDGEKIVPPFIYRMKKDNQKEYYQSLNSKSDKKNDLWQKMINWEIKKTRQTKKLINDHIEEVLRVTPRNTVSTNTINIIEHLMNNPYLDNATMREIQGVSSTETYFFIRHLEERGLVIKRGLRSEGKIFYDVKIFSDMHQKLDATLTS